MAKPQRKQDRDRDAGDQVVTRCTPFRQVQDRKRSAGLEGWLECDQGFVQRKVVERGQGLNEVEVVVRERELANVRNALVDVAVALRSRPSLADRSSRRIDCQYPLTALGEPAGEAPGAESEVQGRARLRRKLLE